MPSKKKTPASSKKKTSTRPSFGRRTMRTAFKILASIALVDSKTKQKPGKTGPSSVLPSPPKGRKKTLRRNRRTRRKSKHNY